MGEIEEVIQLARLRNPNFDSMTTQQQYEFIKTNVDSSLMKEELEFYYDSKFGWPNENITVLNFNIWK